MKNYILNKKASTDNIIECLKTNGIVKIDNYLNRVDTQNLEESFESLIKSEVHPCIKKRQGHPTNADGIQVLVDPIKASKEGIGIFENIFHSKKINEISNKYFSPHKYDLNPQILLNHLKPSPIQILPWHFDRIQTLKFWVYVKDATRNDGAFEYCLGSHWEGRYRSGYHLATGKSVLEIPNDVPTHRIFNPVSVEAKAGDLIIFDPDGFHRGGIVKPKHERCVVRADTFPKPSRKYEDRFLSSGWWLRSKVNLGKMLKKQTFRILGDNINDETINREIHAIGEKNN